MSIAPQRLSVQVSPQELDLWKKIASNPLTQKALGRKVRTSKSGLIVDLANYGALMAQKQQEEQAYAEYYAAEGEKLRRQSAARAERVRG